MSQSYTIPVLSEPRKIKAPEKATFSTLQCLIHVKYKFYPISHSNSDYCIPRSLQRTTWNCKGSYQRWKHQVRWHLRWCQQQRRPFSSRPHPWDLVRATTISKTIWLGWFCGSSHWSYFLFFLLPHQSADECSARGESENEDGFPMRKSKKSCGEKKCSSVWKLSGPRKTLFGGNICPFWCRDTLL